MSNPYDQAAVAATLKAAGRLTAAELAKTLHWPRVRARKALTDLEIANRVTHSPDRSWKLLK